MHPELQSVLTPLGARPGEDGTADFGDPAGELQAADGAGFVAELSHLTVLSFSGEDAPAFLHGQLTCDVAGLEPGHATYGGYCTAKGRLLATFLLWRQGEVWRMLLPQSLAASIQKRLTMFVLRSKVKIENRPLALIGLGGPTAPEAAARAGFDVPREAMAVADTDAGGVGGADRGNVIALPGARWLVVLTIGAAREVWPQLAAALKPVGRTAWEWTEIKNGIPTVTASTQEQFVPQMANLERIGGVSFKKGCYPGQEIVARSQYLGKLKRRLYLGHANAAASSGDELYSENVAGQGNGMVVNAAAAPGGGYDFLAVVQSDSAEQSRVHLRAPDGPEVGFRALPYAVE